MQLNPALRETLASLLADAFDQDQAMNKMLGSRHWRRVAKQYFAIQLDYSDTILVAERNAQIVGALLARSPTATGNWRSLWMFMVMMMLLGRHYLESQRIGYALVERLPRQPHWYINQLAVLQACQSEGIGRQLLQALTALTGDDLVCVDCEDRLQAYYESMGFKLLDAIPGHSLRIMANRTSLTPHSDYH